MAFKGFYVTGVHSFFVRFYFKEKFETVAEGSFPWEEGELTSAEIIFVRCVEQKLFRPYREKEYITYTFEKEEMLSNLVYRLDMPDSMIYMLDFPKLVSIMEVDADTNHPIYYDLEMVQDQIKRQVEVDKEHMQEGRSLNPRARKTLDQMVSLDEAFAKVREEYHELNGWMVPL